MREGRFRPKGQTPHLAECQWDIAPMKSTWKRKGYKSKFRQKRKLEKDTEGNKVRNKRREQTSSRTHG